MARGRMLDQGFVRSHKLRRCSRDARLLYASILPFLDREGRQVAEPVTLKATILRETDFSADEIASLLVELEEAGLVYLYASEDYAAILEYDRFLEFNKPNHKEAKSLYPKRSSKAVRPVRDELLLAAHVARGDARALPGKGQGGTPGPAPYIARGDARHGFPDKVTDKRREELTPTTPSSPAEGEAGGRLKRPPPPAVQAYLDRTKEDTAATDELAALQAKWSKAEGISS